MSLFQQDWIYLSTSRRVANELDEYTIRLNPARIVLEVTNQKKKIVRIKVEILKKNKIKKIKREKKTVIINKIKKMRKK